MNTGHWFNRCVFISILRAARKQRSSYGFQNAGCTHLLSNPIIYQRGYICPMSFVSPCYDTNWITCVEVENSIVRFRWHFILASDKVADRLSPYTHSRRDAQFVLGKFSAFSGGSCNRHITLHIPDKRFDTCMIAPLWVHSLSTMSWPLECQGKCNSLSSSSGPGLFRDWSALPGQRMTMHGSRCCQWMDERCNIQ